MIPAQELVAAARALIGTPFVFRGHTSSELDCVGFVYLAAKRAGAPFEEQPEFDRLRLRGQAGWLYEAGSTRELLERVGTFCTPVTAPTPGCLLLFKFPRLPHPQHLGIYAGVSRIGGAEVETMIHADQARQRVVEVGYRGHWLRRTASAWLLPGIAY